MPGGIQSPFDFNMTIQLQNMVDDIENTCYYGIPQAPNDAAGTTAKMNGLRSILQSNNISPRLRPRRPTPRPTARPT